MSSQGHVRMMVYSEEGDSDKVITDWEHKRGCNGQCWSRHNSQVNSATVSGSKKPPFIWGLSNLEKLFQKYSGFNTAFFFSL